MNLSLPRHFYFCPPDFLELKYAINPWMDLGQNFNLAKAKQEWHQLFRLYENLIPDLVELVPSKEGLTELCFFGDSVFAYKDKAIFSRMAKKERFAETEYAIDFLKKKGIVGKRVPENIRYEGSGETMIWRDKILVGYGQRSSPEVVGYLAEYFNIETIGFELIDPRFYHLDTALFPIHDDLIAVYEPAFSKATLQKIETLGCEIINVNKEDAYNFALNSIVLNQDVILHTRAEHFGKMLEQRGLTVHYQDMSEFIKFGGGLKCLTFQHYL